MTRQRALRCESVGCPAAPTGVCAPCWADEFEMLSGAARRCHVALPSTDLYRQGEPSSNYFVVIEGWVGTRVLLDDGS